MKRSFLLLITLVHGICAFAGGLDQKLIPAGAHWLLHLDCDAFRQSRIGAMIVEDKLESHVRNLENDAKVDFDFSFKKVSAISAFGVSLGEGAEKDGVLLIQTTADIRGDLAKLITLKEFGGNGQPPIAKVSDGDSSYYKIHDELFLINGGQNIWLLGKSKTALDAARQVTAGKAPALTDADFLKFPPIQNSFFFMAVADTGSTGAKLPAHAKILQKADGGRIVIGELGENLFLNLSLKSRDADTIQKIQDVLSGLKALAALGLAEDKDLTALTSSASISSSENIVSVNLSFPLKRAMQKVREDN